MCKKACKRLVSSVSVTVTAEALVINVPQANYDDCEKVCVLVAQAVPATATRGLPVVITVGTGTTQYPVVNCDGTPVTQEYIGQNNVYPLVVRTTATSAIFKVLCKLCYADTNIPAIPVDTAAPAATEVEDE